jgi:Tfp pilus assembly protein PilO
MGLLDSPRNKSLLAIAFALLIGYMVYTGEGLSLLGFHGLKVGRAKAHAMQDSMLVMKAEADSVRRELAKGTVTELKQKTEAYREILDTLRQLVPERGEVPGLIDAISTRAKVRGVHLAVFTPEPVENGPVPFDTYRYRVSVIGHYDQIGQFLTDVAGLRRIIVPMNLTLKAANATSARALGDTSKAMLEAALMVKTFVKSGSSGTGGEGGGGHD